MANYTVFYNLNFGARAALRSSSIRFGFTVLKSEAKSNINFELMRIVDEQFMNEPVEEYTKNVCAATVFHPEDPYSSDIPVLFKLFAVIYVFIIYCYNNTQREKNL